MDEEPDAPLTLDNVTQYPYAAIGVPWSAILVGYAFNGPPDPPDLATDETRVEVR